MTHLPRLLQAAHVRCWRACSRERPAIVIGIDAPDFNLGVEQRLKHAGLRTVHYVSPSVWAWREKRAEKIGRSADRVLCLFPMEPPIYARHGVDARFVGHPLADRFALVSDRAGARDALGNCRTGAGAGGAARQPPARKSHASGRLSSMPPRASPPRCPGCAS